MARGKPGRTPLVAVFCLAAAPRLAYLAWARPVFIERDWALATSLLAHGSLGFDGVPDTGYPPLYPLFIALTRLALGDRPLAVQAVQVGIGAVGAVLMFELTRTLTGRRRVAWLAAGLFAFNPLLVRHAAAADPSTLLSTLLLAFAWTMASAATTARMALAGVWLGLAALARTATLPVLLLAAPALVVGGRRREAAALVACTLLVFAPLPVRNHRVNGSWLPTRDGMNLFIANCQYTAALLPVEHPDLLQDYALSVATAGRPELADRSTFDPELNVRLRASALDWMAGHPAELAALKAQSVAYFFWPRLVPARIPDDETVVVLGDHGSASVVGSRPRPFSDEVVYTATFVPVLLLAVAGAWSRRRERSRDLALWCIAAAFVGVYAVFVPATRYRVAMEFVLLFYAAVALDAWAGLWRPTPPAESGVPCPDSN